MGIEIEREVKSARRILKVILVIIIVACLWAACSFLLNGCATCRHPIFPEDTIKLTSEQLRGFPTEVLHLINTPRKVDRYLRSYQAFVHIRGEWCHTAAGIAYKALLLAGYETHILQVRYTHMHSSPFRHHRVCIYKHKGSWWICGDTINIEHYLALGQIPYGPYKSILDVAHVRASSQGALRDYCLIDLYDCYDEWGKQVTCPLFW